MSYYPDGIPIPSMTESLELLKRLMDEGITVKKYLYENDVRPTTLREHFSRELNIRIERERVTNISLPTLRECTDGLGRWER